MAAGVKISLSSWQALPFAISPLRHAQAGHKAVENNELRFQFIDGAGSRSLDRISSSRLLLFSGDHQFIHFFVIQKDAYGNGRSNGTRCVVQLAQAFSSRCGAGASW